MNNKQTIDENYEDALFAKLMNDHAQIEGSRLLEENERLKNDPAFHMPEGLNELCMETIKKASRTKRYKKIGRTAVTVVKRVAVFALVCSLIFTGLWCTTSAFREAAFRLFTNDSEEKTNVQINDFSEGADKEKIDKSIDEVPEDIGLPTWLPEGYTLTSISCKDDLTNAVYTNDLDNQIIYKELSDCFTAGIDTEDADKVDAVIINGYEGFFVSKGEQFSISWGDTDRAVLIRISSKSLSKDEILQVAKSVKN